MLEQLLTEHNDSQKATFVDTNFFIDEKREEISNKFNFNRMIKLKSGQKREEISNKFNFDSLIKLKSSID